MKRLSIAVLLWSFQLAWAGVDRARDVRAAAIEIGRQAHYTEGLPT